MATRVQPSRRGKQAPAHPIHLASSSSSSLSSDARPPIIVPTKRGTSADALKEGKYRESLIKRIGRDEYLERLTWAFYSFRNIAGYDDIRTSIVEAIAKDSTRTEGLADVQFATISGEERPAIVAMVKEMLVACEHNNKKKLFVTISEPATLLAESHYIVVLFDMPGRKIVVFDPAQADINKKSLYHAPFLKPFLRNWTPEYRVNYFRTEVPCQRLSDPGLDIFCQTWSLYYIVWRVLNFTVKHKKKIAMPDGQRERFDILLKFIKGCVDIPLVKEALAEDLNTTFALEAAERPKARAAFNRWRREIHGGSFVKMILGATVDDMIEAEGPRPPLPVASDEE